MDRWPSGRRRTIGNRVYLQRVSRVRIPVYPPIKHKAHPCGGFCVLVCGVLEFEPSEKGFDYQRKADGSMPALFFEKKRERLCNSSESAE